MKGDLHAYGRTKKRLECFSASDVLYVFIDYKSDSEIYTEPKSISKKGKLDSSAMEKIKKIHLDEK